MKSNFYISVFIFITFSLSSCVENKKESYTISGKFVDGTNPSNKFANLKLTFEDYHNHKKLVTLGETITDANGNFNFTYEYSSTLTSNSLRILVDSNFIGSQKLYSLEMGSNWNKIFYLGDSALLNLNINSSIISGDTLFFSNGDSVYSFIGPISKGSSFKIKLINYYSNGLVGYSIGKMHYPNNIILIDFLPTGEPIIDKLILF